MTTLSPNGRGTDIGNLRDAMAEEDQRCRADIKQVAYNFESGDDPRDLSAALEEVLSASKSRQREIFEKFHWRG